MHIGAHKGAWWSATLHLHHIAADNGGNMAE